MADNPLIHALGHVADTDDSIDLARVRLRASNGFAMDLHYDADEDAIKGGRNYTVAGPEMDSYRLIGDGARYDEDEAEAWRKEGRAELRENLHEHVEDDDTTVEF